MKECRNCGTRRRDSSIYCHACGRKLEAPANCNCGNVILVSDKFCLSCGLPREDALLSKMELRAKRKQEALAISGGA